VNAKSIGIGTANTFNKCC